MTRLSAASRAKYLGPVLGFLQCRTPAAWIERAVMDLDTLLLDHAMLELKAAQQAQKLIWKYGTRRGGPAPSDALRMQLVARMSRLAREELRHFEQVLEIIARRGRTFRALSAARYANGLHALADPAEPGALADALIIGAVIEARSCERFASLLDTLARTDPALADFYASLLRSESRHFEDYLALAREVPGIEPESRIPLFLERDRELVESPDAEIRFLGGVPGVQSAA